MPKVTLDLPDVPGYEYTGEYREPLKDESFWCMYSEKARHLGNVGSGQAAPILRKVRTFDDYAHYVVILKDHPDRKRVAQYEGGSFWVIGTDEYFTPAQCQWIGREIELDWTGAPHE